MFPFSFPRGVKSQIIADMNIGFPRLMRCSGLSLQYMMRVSERGNLRVKPTTEIFLGSCTLEDKQSEHVFISHLLRTSASPTPPTRGFLVHKKQTRGFLISSSFWLGNVMSPIDSASGIKKLFENQENWFRPI
jgi:hypothetical protein